MGPKRHVRKVTGLECGIPGILEQVCSPQPIRYFCANTAWRMLNRSFAKSDQLEVWQRLWLRVLWLECNEELRNKGERHGYIVQRTHFYASQMTITIAVTGTLKHLKSSVARSGGIMLRWSHGYGAGGQFLRPGFDPRSRHIFWRPWIFLSPLWSWTPTGFPLHW